MKPRVWLTATLVILGTLALTTGLAQAQTTSNGPYYATPSWDQKLQCDTLANCPRFIVLSNWNSQAVLDRETGLVWEKSPSTSRFFFLAFPDAFGHCDNLTTGDRKGWRLPTIHELASLVDPTVPEPGPTLPAGHPFVGVQGAQYWATNSAFFSSTGAAVLTLSTSASVVTFVDGFAGGTNPANSFLAWCVRGGQRTQ